MLPPQLLILLTTICRVQPQPRSRGALRATFAQLPTAMNVTASIQLIGLPSLMQINGAGQCQRVWISVAPRASRPGKRVNSTDTSARITREKVFVTVAVTGRTCAQTTSGRPLWRNHFLEGGMRSA